MFSYFLTFIHPDPAKRISNEDLARVREVVRAIPGVTRAHLFTPEVAKDMFFDDGPSPMLTLQLYFERLEVLERTTAHDGALQALASGFDSLEGADAEHQCLWTRPYPTPSVENAPPAGQNPCAYLVHYPGQAEDLNKWLTYYLAHHPQVMFHFPKVREIEIFTRIEWTDDLPFRRVEYMQRNKLVFDSAADLEVALNSPVRLDMKADREGFPPFTGSNIHFPMAMHTVVGPLYVPFQG